MAMFREQHRRRWFFTYSYKIPSADAEFRLSPFRTPQPSRRQAAGAFSVRTGSAKRVFGSIEKRLDRVRCMLTPRKRLGSALGTSHDGPRKVKVMQNVSTMPADLTPDQVLDCLRGALLRKGILCKQDRQVHSRLGGGFDGGSLLDGT
ncbi:putative maternal embryonic leucine zipper kinase [Ixodes scapularis]